MDALIYAATWVIGLLTATILGNTLAMWLAALAVFIVTLGAYALLRVLLGSAAARMPNSDVATGLVAATRLYTGFAIAVLVASGAVHLPTVLANGLFRVVAVIILVQIGLYGMAAVQVGVNRVVARADDPAMSGTVGLLRGLGIVVVWAIVLIAVFANLGIDVTAVLAGLGVGGVAVALALQNILTDLFASMTILLDRPFVVGDSIQVDALSGTVEHIGLKTTRVRSQNGEQLVFGNGDLLKSRIVNWKLTERRAVLRIGVRHDTPIEKLEAIPAFLQETVLKNPHTRVDRAHFVRIAESAYEFEIAWWYESPDYNAFLDTQQAIFLGVVRGFAERGLVVPYPTRSLEILPVTPTISA